MMILLFVDAGAVDMQARRPAGIKRQLAMPAP